MPRRRSLKTTIAALGAAVGLHLAILGITVEFGAVENDPDDPPETGLVVPTPRGDPGGIEIPSSVSLIDEASLASFQRSRLAPFNSDAVGETHPLFDAVDRSGRFAAREGGELEAGPFRETERRDHEDQRAEIWNGKERSQVAFESARTRDRYARSPSAVTRQQVPGFDSTTQRGARARVGQDNPQRGKKEASDAIDNEGPRLPARNWRDEDPLLGAMVAEARDADRRGRVTAKQKAVSDRGDRQADVPRRGRLVGALDSAAASDSKNPAPFELAAPGTGGQGSGAAGEHGPGSATAGRGDGTATTKSKLARGRSAESVRARRGDPYFRALYRKLDQHVVFPRDLAKALEQGTVIARFTLNPDGAISAIKIAKTSGFSGFDKALLSALRKAGPFGPVPARLRQNSQSLRVVAPYRFSNPLIR